MIDALDLAAQRWLHFLADWSLRWGALLLILWLWFTVRPPRIAAVRYLLLCLALAVGLALPLVPRWGPGWIASSAVGSQNQSPLVVSDTREPNSDLPDESAPMRPITQGRPDAAPTTAPTAAPRSRAVPPAPPSARTSPPETAASTPWRRPGLNTVLAALWAVGALTFAVRLLFGWLTLRRLRRQSLSLNGPALHLFEQVRGEIGLRRRVRIAVHREVVSPVLIGGMTPLVLVPEGWQQLAAHAQRSCLLHELAHLARGDDWVRLLLEWLRAILFFHPLVHWLLWRCRHEQELLSDESVVRAGVDADTYARTLSDFASRLSARIRSAPRCAAQALPFLALASVTTRIRKLMEDPMPPRPTPSQRCRLAGAMALVFTLAVALGTARLRALEPPRTGPVASDDRKTSGPERPRDTAPPVDQPAPVPADKELADATHRAVAFLRGRQQDDGTWQALDRWKIGTNSLCTLALLQSGVEPDDPQLAKVLDQLAAAEPPTMIYELSLQTLALCAADTKRYRDTIQRNAELLAEGQITAGENRGGWSYSIERGGFLDLGGDNSNSEFAVWALDEAARTGAKIDPEVWRRTHEYWQRRQNADGSWGYTANSSGTGSMTTSGIASITIAATRLAEADNQFVPGAGPAARGWDWMARHFAVRHNPASSNWLMYYLMTLRRAADLTGKEVVGNHRWYPEGRDFLLQSQDAETGAWKGTGSIESGPLVATSMALLFLNPPPRSARDGGDHGARSELDKNPGPRVDFSVVVARHALLLEGKEIVTWKQIEEKIATFADPSRAHPHFYITRGAREAGVDKTARDEIWRLHGDYKLAGHSLGSLWPRSDLRYDRIKTPADLKPDESLRIEGRVVHRGQPVAGVQIVLVTPVDESISYKSYHMALVQGRVRNPLDHVLTQSDDEGRFAVYPPRDARFSIIALHPERGFAVVDDVQFGAGPRHVQLLEWAGLVSEFAEEPEKQDASLTTRVPESGGRPEIVFNQYWSDLKDRQPTLLFGFTHVPPILETTISRNFPGDDGSSLSLPGASVSLLPGETRRLDLGPLSKQQREHLQQLRRHLQQGHKAAAPKDPTKDHGGA